MSSKRLSKKQIANKKRRQKRNAAQKIEFRKQLLLKSFDDMRPGKEDPAPKVSFPDDTFEFILADERYCIESSEKRRREILFMKF